MRPKDAMMSHSRQESKALSRLKHACLSSHGKGDPKRRRSMLRELAEKLRRFNFYEAASA
jgi:hypothetical protein